MTTRRKDKQQGFPKAATGSRGTLKQWVRKETLGEQNLAAVEKAKPLFKRGNSPKKEITMAASVDSESEPEELLPISEDEGSEEDSSSPISNNANAEERSPKMDEQEADLNRRRKGKAVVQENEMYLEDDNEEHYLVIPSFNSPLQGWITPELLPSHPRALRMQERKLLIERGFDFSIHTFPRDLMTNIENLKWKSFCGGTPGAVEAIVKEFYTNFNPQYPNLTSVRTVPVAVSPGIINAFYNLHHVGADDYKWSILGISPLQMEIMQADLAIPGGEWSDGPLEERTFPSSLLNPLAHAWFKLSARKLRPIAKTTRVPVETMTLIHAIIRRASMDVGGLIMSEISAAAKSKNGRLPFPNLITELCLRANVPMWRGENFCPPKKAIDPASSGWLERQKKVGAWLLPTQGNRLVNLEERFNKFLAFDKERHNFLWRKIGSRFPRYIEGLPIFPDELLPNNAGPSHEAAESNPLFSDDEEQLDE